MKLNSFTPLMLRLGPIPWLTVVGIVCIAPTVVQSQLTSMDSLRPLYRMFRQSLFNIIGRTDSDWAYKWNLQRGKVQTPFREDERFFCDPAGPGARSPSVPQSVHRLRPGDIDVVGALGDSLTAGNGALATNILQVMIENKGVSWSIGGQATWRKFLTLPNMLKVFNPRLYGYSMTDGLSTEKSARFNTAEIGAMSRDIPHEAKVMVMRMTADPRVDVTANWKLITIMIGPNDFCLDICYMNNTDRSVDNNANDLVAALRTLRDNLPRTLINLVIPPSMRIILEMKGKPLDCQTSNHVECPCMFSYRYEQRRKYFFTIMERWQETVGKVAGMVEFNDREDFAVVAQPFLRKVKFPKMPNGNSDFSYMSLDCFHLSQKGYARATNALWNNMFERPGKKATTWKTEFSTVRCPTAKSPFICTNKNCF